MNELEFGAQTLWDGMRWRRLGVALMNAWCLSAVILDQIFGLNGWSYWLMTFVGVMWFIMCWKYGNRRRGVHID